jgi:hypothetical protein
MTTQPEALRLADQLGVRYSGFPSCDEAAAELRRLHAVNQELLEALIELTEAGAEAWGENRPCVRIGLAAIAKADEIGKKRD